MLKSFSKARAQMVAHQLERRGIKDPRVLRVMGSIPRERFMPPAARVPRGNPYADGAHPIGRGQTLSQPYMAAAMTEALQIPERAKILEIGTGTGYHTAILASIAAEVWTVERDPVLAGAARARVDELGIENVQFRIGDGSVGWEEGSPYDGVLVTAGAPDIPPSLVNQLAPRGRLVIPIGSYRHQQLVRVTLDENGGRPTQETLMECRFVPLIGREGWRRPTIELPGAAP